MTLLAQQLPLLPHLEGDGETFEEWLEQLELVATTYHWDDQTKIVNIATRLRGSASRFYCTCPPQQPQLKHVCVGFCVLVFVGLLGPVELGLLLPEGLPRGASVMNNISESGFLETGYRE